jgi:putative peptide zinc metalloprotease protein
MRAIELPVHDDSVVQFQPLTFLPPEDDDGEWIVGHEASDTAITLPAPGVVVIQQLQTGATVAQARSMAIDRYHEDIDVADLVKSLTDLGFVAAVDTWRISELAPIGQRWLRFIPPKAVTWLYSPPLLLLYLALALIGPVLLLADAGIRPQAHDLLWSSSYAVDMVTLLLLTPALLLKHELGHLLAGRGKGLSAELTFGHRFIYLVVVSRVAAVWKLRRRDRLVIYSAGMLNDLVFAGIGSLVLVAAQRRLLPLSPAISGLIALLVISEYVGVAWEFQIFLKTDVYHIMADLTGRHDLPEQARALLTRFLHRFLTLLHLRSDFRSDGEDVHERADWLTVSYTLLAVIGIGGTLIWFIIYLIPATILAITGETAQLVAGLRAGYLLAALDGAVAILSQMIFVALLLWSWARERRARQRQVTSTMELEPQRA